MATTPTTPRTLNRYLGLCGVCEPETMPLALPWHTEGK